MMSSVYMFRALSAARLFRLLSAARSAWVGALLLALPLAGCQDTGTAMVPSGRAAGVPVAFESLEGAPEASRAQFAAVLGSEAKARRLEIVGAGAPARYRIRGYLSAAPAEGGTAITYVWDVFDENARRAQRLTGSATARAETRAGSDPWAAIDATALRQAAMLSLNGIVIFLNDSPSVAPGGTPVAPGGTPVAPGGAPAVADARSAVQPSMTGSAADLDPEPAGPAPLGYAPL